jgi:hypothetical protein
MIERKSSGRARRKEGGRENDVHTTCTLSQPRWRNNDKQSSAIRPVDDRNDGDDELPTPRLSNANIVYCHYPSTSTMHPPDHSIISTNYKRRT